MINPSKLYRLVSGEKVGSLRLLLYVFLGYALSSRWDFWLFIVNTLIMIGGVLFASLLNDYYDYRLLGEKNGVGELLERHSLKKNVIFALIWIPWIGAFVFFLVLSSMGASALSLVLLWVAFGLSFGYSQPPIRLKERPVLGLVTPPVGIFLLYLESLVLTDLPSSKVMMFSVFIFIYTWYLDFIHLAQDSTTKNEIHKIPANLALNFARFCCPIAIFASVYMSFYWSPIMVVAIPFWILRFMFLITITPKDIKKHRKSMLSPLYRVEEFALYALISVFF